MALLGLIHFGDPECVDEVPIGIAAPPLVAAEQRLAPMGSRWSASAWAVARPGDAVGAAPGSELGGGQAGVRVTYVADRARRIALFGRIVTPLRAPGREAALGVEWQPSALPVRLVAEERMLLAGGRLGAGLGVIAGTDGAIPLGFRLESYGQAGAIARDRIEPYADGAARATRTVHERGSIRLALGVGALGRGAARGGADRPWPLGDAGAAARRPAGAARARLAPARGRARAARFGGGADDRERFLAPPLLLAPASVYPVRAMDLYLPIANLSVNALVIVALGLGVGLLSGMFGVGGGFLTTPLLIVYGIPPTVAAASAASQVTGASVSGVFAHLRRGGVDIQMGVVLVAGGVLGSLVGALLFRMLQASGQIDTVIAILYVLMLGSIGGLMLYEAVFALRAQRSGAPVRRRRKRHHPLVAALPLRWRFYRSGLYISPLAPLILGFSTGILTVLLGVGGGFVLVPAMIYLLGMATQVVVGTSLFQILFVTAWATMVHATTTKAVDIVLAGLLLVGSVVGAQLGARFAQRARPEYLRLALAIMVLLVAVRMLLGLAWRPDEIYSVELS